MTEDNEQQVVRMDKWLWAARFFKTRTLAKDAIEGGKVHCNGQRVKVSKEVKTGMELRIRQGFDEKTVIVTALNDVRRGANEAQLLYQETADSIARREEHALQRKAANLAYPDHRPNKKERRQIHRFQDSWQEDA
ncbi:ribosome-associated heat shock protein Hsp15 [Agitococcus lubricus]|uniref:Heat shock protein 15 n=1 Tax=Agitococcus lubricus TaxID=1077255 RepID=A0A2T5J090_9GAMM|nr:ribosome-associated heat shock protein Hsp15 [Agitococcus lubricus]PTQ89686.1 heat shock protein Hsp15 [Agitococcus lubricus]